MSDGEVNELIATLERSNLRRTAAVFKSRFDALTAENERLTRELEEAKDMLANWVTSCVYCGEEWTCSEDTYESSCAEHDKICEKHPLREVERELAAAQQRLASLAVDPAKREELGAFALREQQSAFAEISRYSWEHIADNEYAQEGWMRCGETLFAAGRASLPEVAELERQLAEARKWEGQYRRLYENCDASHEKTLKQLAGATKRLAELTKPADGEELAKAFQFVFERRIGLACWAACGIPWKEAVKEGIRNVRAPLLEQIAELTEKLSKAENDLRLAGQCVTTWRDVRDGIQADHDRLAAELAELESRYEEAVESRTHWRRLYHELNPQYDRLAAELATTKQALADARGEVERVMTSGKPFVEFAQLLSPDLPEWMECRFQANGRPMPTVGDWRDLRTMLEALPPSPSPAKAAASEPVGLCRKCGIQPLTKEGDDMIRLGEKDYLCGNCKRYLCRPIESKAAASEPDDSSHTPETARASSSQSETAERRFVCPECGCTETIETGSTGGDVVRCKKCRYRCTWAEVEAAKGEREQGNPCAGIFDHKWLDPVCVGGGCQSLVLARVSEELKAEVEWRSLGIKSRDALILRLKQQLAAATQAREAEKQRADDTQVRLEAFERSPDEKQKSIWELEEAVSEAEERANENARLLHEQRQRAEAAEAAAGVMRDVLQRHVDAIKQHWDEGRTYVVGRYVWDDLKAALATDPGRAANELRAGKALAGKIRDALCSIEGIAHVERALADYDQALSQGEQRGEGENA